MLYLVDRIDEWLIAHMGEFNSKKFKSIAKADVPLEGQEKLSTEFLDKMKLVLGDRVKNIIASKRLTSSPSCIVYEEQDLTGHMSRLLHMSGQKTTQGTPILEINPMHDLVQHMQQEQDQETFQEITYLLLEQAILLEGGNLERNPLFKE